MKLWSVSPPLTLIPRGWAGALSFMLYDFLLQGNHKHTAYVTLNMYTDIFSDSDKLETQTELIIFLQIQVLKNLVFPSFTFPIHYRSLRCRILRYSGSEAFVRTPSTTPVLLLCGKNLKKKEKSWHTRQIEAIHTKQHSLTWLEMETDNYLTIPLSISLINSLIESHWVLIGSAHIAKQVQ